MTHAATQRIAGRRQYRATATRIAPASMIVAGVALVAAGIGLGLVVWTGRVLGWRRLLWLTDAAPAPALPPLVVGGPYQYLRHPCFWGVALMSAAAAAWYGTAGAWVTWALAVVFLATLGHVEERVLRARFGEAYRRYRRVTPCLLLRARRDTGG